LRKEANTIFTRVLITSWQQAKSSNTKLSYERYIRDYSNGRYVSEATSKKREIEQKEKDEAARRKAEQESQRQTPAQKAAAEIAANMVRIPGGTFTMGCTSEQGGDCYDDEKTIHMVTLGNFSMSKYEVTQEQWRAVMGSDPPELYNKGCDRCPVENVSWDDIQSFISKLNGLTGMNCRLPTEAEWEYGARGGQDFKYAGSNNIDEVAWYGGNYKSQKHGSYGTTKPVGLKKANGYGLYDMTGNVREWCSDWYGSYSASSQTNQLGATTGSYRVNRGGSCFNLAQDCRVSYRRSGSPGYRLNNIGFRLAVSQL